MRIANWNIEAMTGYKPITTYYEDFSIADAFGVDAIKDTYHRAFENWKDNVKYFTEIVMVLNWKCWEHYDAGRGNYCQLYQDLYFEADAYAREHFKGDDLTYYWNTTD